MFGKPAPTLVPKSMVMLEIMQCDKAAEYLAKSAVQRKQYFDTTNKLTKLSLGNTVYVVLHQQSNLTAGYIAKLNTKFKGSFKVVKKVHTNVYLITDTSTEDLFQ